MIRRLIILLLIIGCVTEPEDIRGCTDSDAGNYNPDANIDDSSCSYGNYMNLSLGYDWVYSTKENSSVYSDECGNSIENGLGYYQQFSIDSIHISNGDTIGRMDWDFMSMPAGGFVGSIYGAGYGNNYYYLENQSGLFIKSILHEDEIDTVLKYPLLTNTKWHRGWNDIDYLANVIGNDMINISGKEYVAKKIVMDIIHPNIEVEIIQWWAQGIGLIKNVYSTKFVSATDSNMEEIWHESYNESQLVASGCSDSEVFDCNGICGGSTIIDECNVCDGKNFEHITDEAKLFADEHWEFGRWVHDYYKWYEYKDGDDGWNAIREAFINNSDSTTGCTQDPTLGQCYVDIWDHSHKVEFTYDGSIMSSSSDEFKQVFRDLCGNTNIWDTDCSNNVVSLYDSNNDTIYVIKDHHFYEGIGKYNMFTAGWDDNHSIYVITNDDGSKTAMTPHKLHYQGLTN